MSARRQEPPMWLKLGVLRGLRWTQPPTELVQVCHEYRLCVTYFSLKEDLGHGLFKEGADPDRLVRVWALV